MKYKQPNIKYYSEENTPANVNAYDLTTDKTTIPENHQVVNEIEDISAARVDLEEANADDFPLFYECPICERRFVHHDSFVAHKVIIKLLKLLVTRFLSRDTYTQLPPSCVRREIRSSLYTQ